MRTIVKGLVLFFLCFVALFWAAHATGAAPPPASVKIAVATAWDVDTWIPYIDSGCHVTEQWSAFDGVLDFQGSSANGDEVLDASQTSTTTISGTAVNAYEGTGSYDFEVVTDYQPGGTAGATVYGSGAASDAIYPGYSLEWTYNVAGGGEVTYTRQAHTSELWSWDLNIPQYDGQIASIDVALTPLVRHVTVIERTSTTCGATWGESTIDVRMTLWRL